MPAERRRELWLAPLPAAELAGRLRYSVFASVTIDELFRWPVRQVRHETGSVLAQEGSIPGIHILLDGRVTAGGRDGGASVVDHAGGAGILCGDGRSADARDRETTGRPSRSRSPSTRGRSSPTPISSAVCLRRWPSGRTSLIARFSRGRERARAAGRRADGDRRLRVALRAALPPAADEMQQLAMVAAPVKMAAGRFSRDGAAGALATLTGEVALEPTGLPVSAALGGDTIGSANTMAAGEWTRAVKSSRRTPQDRPRGPVRRPGRAPGPAAPDVRRHVQARPTADRNALAPAAAATVAAEAAEAAWPCGQAPAGRAGCCTTACARRWASCTRRRRGSVSAGFSRKAWPRTTS